MVKLGRAGLGVFQLVELESGCHLTVATVTAARCSFSLCQVSRKCTYTVMQLVGGGGREGLTKDCRSAAACLLLRRLQ